MTFRDSAHQSHKLFNENYSLRSIGELRICIPARARDFNSAMSARIGKPWAQRETYSMIPKKRGSLLPTSLGRGIPPSFLVSTLVKY